MQSGVHDIGMYKQKKNWNFHVIKCWILSRFYIEVETNILGISKTFYYRNFG